MLTDQDIWKALVSAPKCGACGVWATYSMVTDKTVDTIYLWTVFPRHNNGILTYATDENFRTLKNITSIDDGANYHKIWLEEFMDTLQNTTKVW